MTGRHKVMGAIGVIGPARLNYARVIPLVDYTARVLGRMLDG
jgi:heat-inducible transcriptional repressor